jgi:predicted nucleotidyltransferase
MTAAGLVSVESVGNQKHYRANAASPVFDELYRLVLKTVGLTIPILSVLEPLASHVAAAFVYGSVAKGTEQSGSDIDLLVIGDNLDYAQLFDALPDAEAQLGRPINPTVMTVEEWRRKRNSKDSFAARIAAQPKLFVLGNDDALK